MCFFSFSFITQNIRTDKSERKSRRRLSLHTQECTVRIFRETSLLFYPLGRNLCGFIIFRTPTQIIAVTSPTCYLHVARGQRFFLECHPHNLRRISAETSASCLLWVPGAFPAFVPSVELPSSISPTQFTRHVKRIFKLISNTRPPTTVWYHHHLHVTKFYGSLARSKCFAVFCFLLFLLYGPLERQVLFLFLMKSSFLFLNGKFLLLN